ncbi:MAG TPA: hypothetical protein DD417_04595 [Elusimicrobia bacterium]|nr:hypothetical protein [Elusimicrobiota bacterium]
MKPLPKCDYFRSQDRDPLEDRLRQIAYADAAPARPQKVAVVVPPSPQVPTPGREFLVTGPFEGFTYVATLIKKMGFPLTTIDCRLKDDPVALVLAGIAEADLVCLGAFCDSFAFLEDVSKAIKAKYPEKRILLGGPLVTSLPEILLKNTAADFAVLGEAELTLIEFLDRGFAGTGLDLAKVRGLAWRDGGAVRVNPPRPQIKDLDNLPVLDYTIWPNYQDIVKNGQILISTMRGCPQDCSFCFKTIPMLRMKSLERFEEEVVLLKQATGFSYTWLNDLTFNVIEDRAMKVARILKKHGIRYHCFARVQKVGEPLVRVLSETGCEGIWFGIESTDQEILDYNRKNIDLAEIDQAVQVATRAGLAVRGLFIVGLYGETEESLKAMVEYIRKSRFLPLVKYLVPFPGTSLFTYAVEKGKIKDTAEFLRMLSNRKIRDYDDEIVNITDLPDETLRKYFHEIWAITKEREACNA